MMNEKFVRSAMLLGEDKVNSLAEKKVAIFGVGGVGGHAAEALVRTGVGSFVLVDHDTVSESNINRQIIATVDTIGKSKVEVMKQRMLSVNPLVCVETRDCFFLPENAESFDFSSYDYVVDAVDTVTAKLEIIARAKAAGVPVISAMGAGNKLDPTRFEVADIEKTSVCPLAKVMRRELKKRNICGVKVVYSKEEALVPLEIKEEPKEAMSREEASKEQGRKKAPGSLAFVPSVAGLILASEVIKDLTK